MKNMQRRFVLQGQTAKLFEHKNFASAEEYGNPQKFFGASAQNHSDLKFIDCILTEEGANRNGHYFSQSLLIKYHMSARLKPFNIGHNKTEIIGVMYDSALANSNNEIISNDDIGFTEDGTPYYKGEGPIRVRVAAALYGAIGRDEVDAIVSAVKAGESVAVSMEAWFEKWDWKLVGKNGESDIVFAAQADNFYLFDYLGKEYGGRRVLQAFKEEGFLFGGIGQVTVGACPASQILAAAASYASAEVDGPTAFRNLNEITKRLNALQGNSSEAEAKNTVEATINEGEKHMNKVKILDPTTGRVIEVDESDPRATASAIAAAMTAGKTGSSELEQNSALATIIQQTEQITTLKLNLEQANKEKEAAEAAARLAKEEVEGFKTAGTEKVNELTEQLKAAQASLKATKYILALARDHKDVVISDEASLHAAFAAEDFTDEKFNAFVTAEKAKVAQAEEGRKKAVREAKCELLKLSADATDEQIAEAEAKFASISSEVENPGTPVQTSEAKQQAAAAQNVSSASASAANSGIKRGVMNVTAYNTETGQTYNITSGNKA